MPGCMKMAAELSIGLLGAPLKDAQPVSAAERDPIMAVDISARARRDDDREGDGR
jgi:hypothetical protein